MVLKSTSVSKSLHFPSLLKRLFQNQSQVQITSCTSLILVYLSLGKVSYSKHLTEEKNSIMHYLPMNHTVYSSLLLTLHAWYFKHYIKKYLNQNRIWWISDRTFLRLCWKMPVSVHESLDVGPTLSWRCTSLKQLEQRCLAEHSN